SLVVRGREQALCPDIPRQIGNAAAAAGAHHVRLAFRSARWDQVFLVTCIGYRCATALALAPPAGLCRKLLEHPEGTGPHREAPEDRPQIRPDVFVWNQRGS